MLLNSVQALCCDTTASNTGRFKRTCVLLEQKLDKDLLYLLCHLHIYELILRGVFKNKFPQVTKSPDISLFKKFQKNRNNFNRSKFLAGIENVKCCLALEDERNEILGFFRNMLTKTCYRHNYRELVELVVIVLNGDLDKIKIQNTSFWSNASC